MLESFSNSARDWMEAAALMGAFLLAMLVVRLLWLSILRPFIKRTKTALDDVLVLPLRSLVVWGILLLGLNHSIGSLEAIQQSERLQSILLKVLGVAWVLLFIWIAWRIFNGLLAWYAQSAATRPEGARDVSHQVSFSRKTVNILILAVGILYVLRMLEVDISPLLAGGAIGGIAIALALQDTLSNLFAGLYLTIDRPISQGDFIKLESGDEGFVEEIGWRNTKVRLWANNIVVIPNSKLSQSVITNYFLPQQEMSVYVFCGVAYDSDLQRVEDVTVEVAKQVMQQTEGTLPDWEPVVRWKEFGDFAITFVTVLRVREFGVQYALASEFIKALHRRFKKENIEIPFPIRTLIMKPSAPAEPSARGEIERS